MSVTPSKISALVTALTNKFALVGHTHSGYATSTHNHGYIYNDGKVDSIIAPDPTYTDYLGVLGVFGSMDDFDYAKIVPTNSIATTIITNANALSNIRTSANATQYQINNGINTALGNKLSATKVTSWSSTPSDSNVASEKLVKDTFDDIEDLIGDAIAYINQ